MSASLPGEGLRYLCAFTLRRDLDTGALEVDGYMQFDAQELADKQLMEDATAALEDRKPVSLTTYPDYMLAGMLTRSKSDHNIIGMYSFRTDERLAAAQFRSLIKGWALDDFKQFRVRG